MKVTARHKDTLELRRIRDDVLEMGPEWESLAKNICWMVNTYVIEIDMERTYLQD
jgi:hypothetical protein